MPSATLRWFGWSQMAVTHDVPIDIESAVRRSLHSGEQLHTVSAEFSDDNLAFSAGICGEGIGSCFYGDQAGPDWVQGRLRIISDKATVANFKRVTGPQRRSDSNGVAFLW